MLSKPVGPTGLFTLNGTTGTFTATITALSDLSNYSVKKVRIAVTQPAVIAFGNPNTSTNNVANNDSDILMPANTVEHFSVSTSTITFISASGASTGTISITPVA